MTRDSVSSMVGLAGCVFVGALIVLLVFGVAMYMRYLYLELVRDKPSDGDGVVDVSKVAHGIDDLKRQLDTKTKECEMWRERARVALHMYADHECPDGDETSASIARWQEETFGSVDSNWSSVVRAQKEWDELRDCVCEDDDDPRAVMEIADVAIVLSRILAFHGRELKDVINEKMKINRARKWSTTGDGHGQHVKE